MADATDSKSVVRKDVWVQVPPPVLENKYFLVLGRLTAPEDKVPNPNQTHNSCLGKRIGGQNRKGQQRASRCPSRLYKAQATPRPSPEASPSRNLFPHRCRWMGVNFFSSASAS